MIKQEYGDDQTRIRNAKSSIRSLEIKLRVDMLKLESSKATLDNFKSIKGKTS